MKNTIYKLFTLLTFVVALTSCSEDKTKRKIAIHARHVYFCSVRTLWGKQCAFASGMDSQAPVSGAIARGQVPYDYAGFNRWIRGGKERIEITIDLCMN